MVFAVRHPGERRRRVEDGGVDRLLVHNQEPPIVVDDAGVHFLVHRAGGLALRQVFLALYAHESSHLRLVGAGEERCAELRAPLGLPVTAGPGVAVAWDAVGRLIAPLRVDIGAQVVRLDEVAVGVDDLQLHTGLGGHRTPPPRALSHGSGSCAILGSDSLGCQRTNAGVAAHGVPIEVVGLRMAGSGGNGCQRAGAASARSGAQSSRRPLEWPARSVRRVVRRRLDCRRRSPVAACLWRTGSAAG